MNLTRAGWLQDGLRHQAAASDCCWRAAPNAGPLRARSLPFSPDLSTPCATTTLDPFGNIPGHTFERLEKGAEHAQQSFSAGRTRPEAARAASRRSFPRRQRPKSLTQQNSKSAFGSERMNFMLQVDARTGMPTRTGALRKRRFSASREAADQSFSA